MEGVVVTGADGYAQFCAAELTGLARLAMALTGDRQSAHDVLADALVKIQLNWSRVAAADSPPRYARRVLTNVFLSRGRSGATRRLRLTVTGELPDRAVPDPTAAVDDRDLLIGLLGGLPAQQRAVVVMRYLLDATDDDIAAAVGCSRATVRSHLSRALAALRVTAARARSE